MKYILFSIAAAGVIPAAFFMVYDRRLLRITAFLIPLCALAFQQTAINFFSHELYRGTSRGMEVSLSYLCALVILLAILMRLEMKLLVEHGADQVYRRMNLRS